MNTWYNRARVLQNQNQFQERAAGKWCKDRLPRKFSRSTRATSGRTRAIDKRSRVYELLHGATNEASLSFPSEVSRKFPRLISILLLLGKCKRTKSPAFINSASRPRLPSYPASYILPTKYFWHDSDSGQVYDFIPSAGAWTQS